MYSFWSSTSSRRYGRWWSCRLECASVACPPHGWILIVDDPFAQGGIWKLHYQRALTHFPRLAPDTEFLLVYNLVGIDVIYRDTARGWSPFAVRRYSTHCFIGVPFFHTPVREWRVIIFSTTRQMFGTEYDLSLRFLSVGNLTFASDAYCTSN